jgi:hypothetical protein
VVSGQKRALSGHFWLLNINLDRRFRVLTDDVIQNRADFRKFDQRLADLEQPPRA